jgi:hypothetical protein
MVEYLTFDEYTEMGGTITDEALFNSLTFDAQAYIDWYTFNRLWKEEWRTEEIMERVKICMFQLIKLLNVKSSVITPDVSSTGGINVNAQLMSQANDGVSATYAVLSGNALYEKAKEEIDDCIKRYLNGLMNSMGRQILYRGLYPNE